METTTYDDDDYFFSRSVPPDIREPMAFYVEGVSGIIVTEAGLRFPKYRKAYVERAYESVSRMVAEARRQVREQLIEANDGRYDRPQPGTVMILYGSFHRPMDSMWAKLPGAVYVDANPYLPFGSTGITPYTYVCVRARLDAATMNSYELMPLGEVTL